MSLEIKVPSVGESVTEALLSQWYKEDGDSVGIDEPLFVIETDKVTLEVTAEAGGILKINVSAGEMVAIGAVVGIIDTDAVQQTPSASELKPDPEPAAEAVAQESPGPPAVEAPPAPAVQAASPDAIASQPGILPPSVRRLAAENKIDLSLVHGTGPGGRITKGDVLLHLERSPSEAAPASTASTVLQPSSPVAVAVAGAENITRKPMSPIRRRIAEHLLNAKQNTAMLTTFNEIDMSAVMEMRSRYKVDFKEKFEVSLGFMSFFIKATIEALKEFPQINAFIDGDDFVYHDYYHIGVAIGSGRGLVVPVIRHAQTKTFAELEQAIVDFVTKINENRLELSDLEGGTYTISNGGVYGSLLSTPILNSPQSGILGLHKIEKRAVVIDDNIVIRPMMYVAMSYDHRIVDGREAVSCLKRIKECIENPERIMMEI